MLNATSSMPPTSPNSSRTDARDSGSIDSREGKTPTPVLRSKNVFTLASYNLDTNIARTEEGLARTSHPNWRVGDRMPELLRILDSLICVEQPDLIHIQETRCFLTKFGDQVDSVTPVRKYFEAKGLEVVVRKYNDGGGDKAFQFITAFKPQKMQLRNASIKYLTRTPDQFTERPGLEGKSEAEKKAIMDRIRENNFGVEWERGVSILEFSHSDFPEPLYSINVHIDLAEQPRLQSMELIAQFVRDILAKQPNARIVIAGDFNTIPDRKGPEQLKIIRDATHNGNALLHEATEDLRWPSGEKANHTFISFPFDFIGLKKDMDVRALAAALPSLSHQAEAKAALDRATSQPFNLNAFLEFLSPECRKAMVGLVFSQSQCVGGVLDRVFHHGFKAAVSCTVVPANSFPIPGNLSFNDGEGVKAYVMDAHQHGPAFASDHQPVITTLSL